MDKVEYYSLGELLVQLSRHDEALEVYKQAIQVYPNESSLYSGLGSLYEKLNRKADAIELYKQAIHAIPNDADAYIKLGDIYKETNKIAEATEIYKKAVEVIRSEIQKRPTPYSYSSLANTQEKLSLYDEMIETYRQAAKLFPEDDTLFYFLSESYTKLADTYAKLKQFPKAIELLKEAISLGSKLDFIHLRGITERVC